MRPPTPILSRRAMLIGSLSVPFAAHAQREAPPNAVTLRLADFQRDGLSGLFRVAVPPLEGRARPLFAAQGPNATAADRLIADLIRRGRGAGNEGDVYDNRDRGHSRLQPGRHPGATFVLYADDARASDLDLGLNDRVRFEAPTVGNASLAVTGGPLRRSLPRAAMTTAPPGTVERVGALHRANHLYVHPAHRDHHPDDGDLFPAMTPYWVLTQGSSGSDRPFAGALLDALAAFRPDTKARLVERGLIAPTLQSLLRRSMASIESDADYLSPAAHPTVFDAGRLDRERLIRAANALAPDQAAPPPRLGVAAEPAPLAGAEVLDHDLFGDGLSERLFDAPEAIARVAHGARGSRRYRLRAQLATDERAPARFLWRVLRGPGVVVSPLGADGAEAEVAIPWTPPYAAPDTGFRTVRVEIGVFAEIGGALSAPSFFTVAFPPDRQGEWAPDGRPLVLTYGSAHSAGYIDPALFPRRDWRDVFEYDAASRLVGWRRQLPKGGPWAYTRHGLRVVDVDELGRPVRAEAVAYRRSGRHGERIVEEPLGRFATYVYADADDRFGGAQPAP